MIRTVDNFKDFKKNKTSSDKTDSNIKKITPFPYTCEIGKSYKSKTDFNITLNQYKTKSSENKSFSFFRDNDKIEYKNNKNDDLILSLSTHNYEDTPFYQVETGNYIGKFIWNGLEIDIQSRFGHNILERMLNFANDVFLNDVSALGNVSNSNSFDITRYFIYYMFVQKLGKAFLLGLPKSYKSIKFHETKLEGNIDINNLIKKDIPFKGKISSVSRRQIEEQEVIDILYKAITIINNNKFSIANISHIYSHLNQNKTNKYVSNETINIALQSKALRNPVFAPYKKILEYAKFIINKNKVEDNNKGKLKYYGFLINIAELFEIYLLKLIRNKFSDWNVSSPKITTYQGQFYERFIIPDIVMERGDDVIVFDAKYKKMQFKGPKSENYSKYADLDRSDFFQIHTYLSYYESIGKDVIAGGLLYPIEVSENEFKNKTKRISNYLFGEESKNNTKFIVDGIRIPTKDSLGFEMDWQEELINNENKFLDRISRLISNS
jgi:5-methylcytosine-specific restriction enzyme subunit McrC